MLTDSLPAGSTASTAPVGTSAVCCEGARDWLLWSGREDAANLKLLNVTTCTDRADPGASDAVALARRLLQGLDARLAHSATVAAQVSRVTHLVEPGWRCSLNEAAWLHDVGYSSEVALTSFHALDGARWLRAHHWPAETCRLVAWHTGAFEEALLYGLDEELVAEFDQPRRLAAAALTWADLTSSPSGERWDAEQRVAEILSRHAPGTLVHAATRRALPTLRAAVQEIQRLLSDPR